MAKKQTTPGVVMDPAIVGLGGLLNQFHLRVPSYQRNYAWKDDEVNEYLDDIHEAQTNKVPGYFFGTVVLAQRRDDSLEVIDGQQRLATTYMVIAAVRNRLVELGAIEHADDIDKRFLNSLNLDTAKRSPKLALNVDDNALFADLVAKDPRQPQARYVPRLQGPSNRKIASAWGLVSSHISKLEADSPTNAQKRLLAIAGFLSTKARVIRLIVPDEISAYTIFETLNDRGLELAIADLLKNYLYSRAGKRLNEVSAAWNQMTGKLNVLKERDVIVQFISHFWSSKHGLTRRKALLTEAKSAIRSSDAAHDISIELRDNADTYLALTDPTNGRWKGVSKDRSDAIRVISQILRIVQIRPLLLSIADQWADGEQVKAFRLLVNCAVRVLVAGARGGTIEKLYNESAYKVREGGIKNTIALRDFMKISLPTDDRFREEFQALRVPRNDVARYYLAALERNKGGAPTRDDDNTLSLEHVLPEDHDPSLWSEFKPDQHRAYRYSIGNLCLLRVAENNRLRNSAFAQKLPVLARSEFALSKEISLNSEWRISQIEQRSTLLAERATKTWPISDVYA